MVQLEKAAHHPSTCRLRECEKRGFGAGRRTGGGFELKGPAVLGRGLVSNERFPCSHNQTQDLHRLR